MNQEKHEEKGKEKEANKGKEKEKDKEDKSKKLVGPWIIKPHDAAGGHGITIVKNLSDIGYLGMVQLVSKWKKLVVSQYVFFFFISIYNFLKNK